MSDIHHVGYVVEDLEAAAHEAARTYGAGPFFLIDHVGFSEVTHLDEPAAYDHSAAFGRWGPILMELNQVFSAEPPELLSALGTVGLGHVGWLTNDLDADRVRLEAAGMRCFHTGRTGPVSAAWFDGTPVLGHHVEVLQRSEGMTGFHEMVRAAGEDWDGQDPFRPWAGWTCGPSRTRSRQAPPGAWTTPPGAASSTGGVP